MRFVSIFIAFTILAAVDRAAAQTKKRTPLDFNGDSLPDGAIARLGTTRFQPDARAIALTPDGEQLVAIENDCNGRRGMRVDFFDSATGKKSRGFEVNSYFDGHRIQFTSDGKAIVLNDWTGAKVVDIASGKLSTLIDAKDRVWSSSIALSFDGKFVATQKRAQLYHAPVSVWEAKTNKEVALLPGVGASCQRLIFSPNGSKLLLQSQIPTDVTQNGMSFGGEDSKTGLACIDIKTRKIIGEMKVSDQIQVTLCPDGESVALKDAENTSIRIKHLPTGAERCAIFVKPAFFAFAPDGKILFTIDEDGQGTLWETTNGKKIRDLEGKLINKDVSIVGFSKDGSKVAVVDGGWQSVGVVVIWNTATGKRNSRPPGHNGTVTCIAYAPDGKMLVSGSLDSTVRLWNPATGEHLRILTVHKEGVAAVAVSSDGKLVASSSQSGEVRVNTFDGSNITELTGPDKGATALAFSHDGKRLFAGGQSPELLVWDIAQAKEVARLKTGDDGAVMAFGDGGDFALTANGEVRNDATPERLQVWHPMGRKPATSININDKMKGTARCDAAVFSHDGRLFASSQISESQGIRPSYDDAKLRLWERISGQPIRTLSPTITRVVSISPNGRFLASGGTGRSGHLTVGYGSGIDFWDMVTGEKVGTLPATPRCASFSPDGLHLATGGCDHCITIWKAPELQPIKKVNEPSAAEREAWWSALGKDAAEAYKVVGPMLNASEHTVAMLKERVLPVKSGDPETVTRLIANLDNNKFAERERSQIALEKMGQSAAHLVLKALEGNLTSECRRRLEEVQRKCGETSSNSLRFHRAIAVLEWIGTSGARAQLKALADGAPQARVTIESRAALRRLESLRN